MLHNLTLNNWQSIALFLFLIIATIVCIFLIVFLGIEKTIIISFFVLGTIGAGIFATISSLFPSEQASQEISS
jgi:hypothetical protein